MSPGRLPARQQLVKQLWNARHECKQRVTYIGINGQERDGRRKAIQGRGTLQRQQRVRSRVKGPADCLCTGNATRMVANHKGVAVHTRGSKGSRVSESHSGAPASGGDSHRRMCEVRMHFAWTG